MKQKLQRSDHLWHEVSKDALKVLEQKRQVPFETRLNAGKHAAALRQSEPAYSNVFEVLVYGKDAGQLMSPEQASKSLLPPPTKVRKRKQRKHPGRTRELRPKRQRYHRERRAKLKKRAQKRAMDDQRAKERENEEIEVIFDF